MRLVLVSVLVTAFCVGAAARLAAQTTRRVPSQYKTVQAAMDAAGTGDSILVAAGSYRENIDFKGKSVTLRSVSGAGLTTLDGGGVGSAVTFKRGEGRGSRLIGFSIVGGNAVQGGGVYCYRSSPILEANWIKGNSATSAGGGVFSQEGSPWIRYSWITSNYSGLTGGGIAIQGGSPFVTRCRVTWNIASFAGGGLYLEGGAPVVTNSAIENNGTYGALHGSGGGIHCERSAAVVRENLIAANLVVNAHAQGGGVAAFESPVQLIGNTIKTNRADYGGGVDTWNSATARLAGNRILQNRAVVGGGVRCMGPAPSMNGDLIADNRADHGGGLSFDYAARTTIMNLVICRNQAIHGGGLHCADRSHVSLIHCTVCDNAATGKGGALYCAGTPLGSTTAHIRNSILWMDSAKQGGAEIHLDPGGSAVVEYSTVDGGWTGRGNQQGDPQFVNMLAGDCHLLATSPCIGAGMSAAAWLPSTDRDGNPRDPEAGYDQGADQFHPHLYLVEDPRPKGQQVLTIIGAPRSGVHLAWSPERLVPALDIPGVGKLHLGPRGLVVVSIGAFPASGAVRIPLGPPASNPQQHLVIQALVQASLTSPVVIDLP